MKYLIAVLLFLAVNTIHAQKFDPPQTPNDWFPQQIRIDQNGIDYLLTSPTEALIPVLIGKTGYGIVKINDRGNELWKAELPGIVRAFGKAGENLVVVYETEEGKKTTLTSVLFVSSNGKKLSEENIFVDTEDRGLRYKFENNASGDLVYLLVWKTEHSKKIFFRERIPVATKGCNIIHFDGSGNKKKTTLLQLPEDAYIFGSTLNKYGELFIVYYFDGQLVTEKLDVNLKSITKLRAPLEVHKISRTNSIVRSDPSDAQKLLVSATIFNKGKDNAHQTFLFDFNSGRALFSLEEETDKSFRSSFELKEVDGIYKLRSKSIEGLVPVGLFAAGNRIIVLEQMEGTYAVGKDGKLRYTTAGLFITFYDQGLKKIKTIGLGKKYESFIAIGRSLGTFHKEGKLYVTSTAIAGPATYKSLFCVVDIESADFEKVILIDNGTLSNNKFIEGDATIWFDKHGLISYIIDEGGFLSKSNFKAAFQRVEY